MARTASAAALPCLDVAGNGLGGEIKYLLCKSRADGAQGGIKGGYRLAHARGRADQKPRAAFHGAVCLGHEFPLRLTHGAVWERHFGERGDAAHGLFRFDLYKWERPQEKGVRHIFEKGRGDCCFKGFFAFIVRRPEYYPQMNCLEIFFFCERMGEDNGLGHAGGVGGGAAP